MIATAMYVDLRKDNVYQPVWKGGCFTDNAKECTFQAQQAHCIIRATQLWAVLRVLADVLLALPALWTGVSIWFYLAHIPNALVCLGTVLLLYALPQRFAKRVALTSAVLISTGGGLLAHVQAVQWLAHARDTGLAHMFKEMSSSVGAQNQLGEYLGSSLATGTLDAQFLLLWPQLLLLVSLGLCKVCSRMCVWPACQYA